MARRATAVFAALAAADALLAATGHGRPRRLTKPLLTPVLMAGRDRPVQRALALGGAGDVALLGDLRRRPGTARRVTSSARRVTSSRRLARLNPGPAAYAVVGGA